MRSRNRLHATLAAAAAAAAALCAIAGSSRADFVPLQNPTATFSQSGFFVGQAIDGSAAGGNGWAVLRDTGETNAETAVFETVTNLGPTLDTELTFTLQQLFSDFHTIGKFRLSVTSDARSLFADGLPINGDVTANWTILTPLTAAATNGATLTIGGDKSILAVGSSPPFSTYTVTASTALHNITGFRLEVLTDPSLPTGGPGRQFSNGNFVLSEFRIDASVKPVPEPSSVAMFGIGIASLAVFARRRA